MPARYDGNVSWPLLVGFHGWGGSGNHSLDAFHAHGKAAGYIVASPDGFAEDVGLGSWNPNPNPNPNRNPNPNPNPNRNRNRNRNRNPNPNPNQVGLGSWNGAGTTSSPGPEGPTCHDPNRTFAPNCYASCRRREDSQRENVSVAGCADSCWWTTCEDSVAQVVALLDEP